MDTTFNGMATLTAQFLAACEIKCRKARGRRLQSPSRGRAEYRRLFSLLEDCEEVCGPLAELCFYRNPTVARLLQLHARLLEGCARECDKLQDRCLGDLAFTCRESARACTYYSSYLCALQVA
jgi:hypothetical protein